MKTKVQTIKVGDEVVHLFWDNASALDFAQVSGIEDINEVQMEMAKVLTELAPGEGGAVKISSLEAVARMIYVAINTGHEHKEEEQPYSLRWVRNAMLSDTAASLIEAFAAALAQYMPDQTQKPTATKKKTTQK